MSNNNNMPSLYLCGPMSGLPDHNRPTFNEAAKTLRSLGFSVFNPTENGVEDGAHWEEHMAADLIALITSARPGQKATSNTPRIAVATVPGLNVLDQPNSKGMRLELAIEVAAEDRPGITIETYSKAWVEANGIAHIVWAHQITPESIA